MKDLCIVGFGLAGLSVARQAEKAGLCFDIISDASQLSSRVAGGILNPVAVKRMKPVWKVEYFLSQAVSFYKTIEKDFAINIYQDIPLQVVIHNTEQENNWYEAYDKPRLQPFLRPDLIHHNLSMFYAKKFGLINAGLVNLSKLFKEVQRDYLNTEKWIEQQFQYHSMQIFDDKVVYGNKDYKHVVFCEGFGVTLNPYFSDLEIYGNKGDYLILKSEGLKLENIAKAKYFLIPIGDDLYKFGATYQRQPLNHQPSKDARNQMIEALDKMINVPYSIVDQVCGIRPTTKDRKPILGTHRNQKRLHILNGFGSRGVMMAPQLGKDLIDNIFNGEPIDEEVSIQRIYARI